MITRICAQRLRTKYSRRGVWCVLTATPARAASLPFFFFFSNICYKLLLFFFVTDSSTASRMQWGRHGSWNFKKRKKIGHDGFFFFVFLRDAIPCAPLFNEILTTTTNKILWDGIFPKKKFFLIKKKET